MAPATAVDHLLVGQHRGALGAPVDLALLAIGQAALVHTQKEPLVPAIVVGQAGGDFGGPVKPHAQALELPLHSGDIVQCPLAWGRVVLECRVLCRQAKRVPAHGVQHVVAAHPHMARQGVADRVVTHMAHMQLAAGIGQHLQHVILRLVRPSRIGRIERRVRRPARLPLRLNCRWVVSLFFVFRHHF